MENLIETIYSSEAEKWAYQYASETNGLDSAEMEELDSDEICLLIHGYEAGQKAELNKWLPKVRALIQSIISDSMAVLWEDLIDDLYILCEGAQCQKK